MKNATKLLTLTLALVMALSVFLFASCAKDETKPNNDATLETKDEQTENTTPEDEPKEEAPEKIRIITLAGPTGMGMAKLIDDDKNGTAKYDYEFTVSSAPDQVSPEVIKGNYDVACVPVNLASVLYNKTEGKLGVVAMNTLGILYMLENGNTINSVEDLRGKTIYATGQGSNPEYVL
ncbi:MAG: ABC transporter substrate-binding protein, partial [Clostridia bacterium]|nr:ABC transporter substrate-binding protein [Clostridia bacterium]